MGAEQVLTCCPRKGGFQLSLLRWLLAAVFGIEDPNVHLGSPGQHLHHANPSAEFHCCVIKIGTE